MPGTPAGLWSTGAVRSPAVAVLVAAGLVAAMATVGCGDDTAARTAPSTPAATEAPGLQALAAPHGVRMGTAVRANVLAADPGYGRTIAAQYGIVTPENDLKFAPTEPQRGRFDFAAADAVVAFAERHGLAVRGHTLVWHRQLPAWLTEGRFDARETRAVLRAHIAAVVGRYRGRIAQWDVVNEAVDEDGRLRDNLWLRVLGPGYIGDAFQAARAADPEARLFLNEFAIEAPGPKADATVALVARLRAEGVPIDGVGFQAHATPGAPSGEALAGQLRRVGRLGLETAVTEADVRLDVPATPAALARQANTYRQLLEACLREPSCHTFATWGFTDAWSWIAKTFPGQGAALPFDERYRPKPAQRAMAAALRARR